jgi:hypothetical protein
LHKFNMAAKTSMHHFHGRGADHTGKKENSSLHAKFYLIMVSRDDFEPFCAHLLAKVVAVWKVRYHQWSKFSLFMLLKHRPAIDFKLLSPHLTRNILSVTTIKSQYQAMDFSLNCCGTSMTMSSVLFITIIMTLYAWELYKTRLIRLPRIFQCHRVGEYVYLIAACLLQMGVSRKIQIEHHLCVCACMHA